MSKEHPNKILMDYLEASAACLEEYVENVVRVEDHYSAQLAESGFSGALSRGDLIDLVQRARLSPDGDPEDLVDAWVDGFRDAHQGDIRPGVLDV